MTVFIYMFLCGLTGFICSCANINLNDWKYWILLGCVIGSFFCGKYDSKKRGKE